MKSPLDRKASMECFVDNMVALKRAAYKISNIDERREVFNCINVLLANGFARYYDVLPSFPSGKEWPARMYFDERMDKYFLPKHFMKAALCTHH